VTTYKTYHGTHYGAFLGVAPTGRKIHFETVDVMRVRNGKCIGETGMSAPGSRAAVPPRRRGKSDRINSTHIHGTHVPVEEPSTASFADLYRRPTAL
jgi:hypothetical protein